MSTRGSIYFMDQNGDVIFDIYKHHDCYPSGLGKELLDFFKSMKTPKDYGCGHGILSNAMIYQFIQAIAKDDDYAYFDASFNKYKNDTPEDIAIALHNSSDQEYTYIIQINEITKNYIIHVYYIKSWIDDIELIHKGELASYEYFINKEVAEASRHWEEYKRQMAISANS